MSLAYSMAQAPLSPQLIGEIATLSERIFSPPAIDYSWRLTHMPLVTVFCAREAQRLVAFKAGYAVAEHNYYSWLGAVDPDFRRQGIATELARRQQDWLVAQGFRRLGTATLEDNAAMAQVNWRSGFVVVGTRRESYGLQLLWSKELA